MNPSRRQFVGFVQSISHITTKPVDTCCSVACQAPKRLLTTYLRYSWRTFEWTDQKSVKRMSLTTAAIPTNHPSADKPIRLYEEAFRIYKLDSATEKAEQVQILAAKWFDDSNSCDRELGNPIPMSDNPCPGLPNEPKLVKPFDMPRPKQDVNAVEFYLHSVAHVEFNAINLCLDNILRFPGMPLEYYSDFLKIAEDESRHFLLLQYRLLELGSYYGKLSAHQIIHQTAEKSTHSLACRMALGQLVQEARGVDAAPTLATKLNQLKDSASSAIVKQIGDEEIDHVRLGLKWYLYAVELENLGDPIQTFHKMALDLANPGALIPPFDEERRRLAGITPEWYQPIAKQMLQMLEARKKRKASSAHPRPQQTHA